MGTVTSLALGVTAPRWRRLLAGDQVAGATPGPGLEGLTRDAFEPLVGTRFRLRPESGRAIGVVLHQVDDWPVQPADPPEIEGDAYSLLFTGRGVQAPQAGLPDRPLEQGTYAVEHPSLGSIPLFVVPVGLGRERQAYEVIVNRRSAAPGAQPRRSRAV